MRKILLCLLILLASIHTVSAQEEAKDQKLVISDFSGGIATKPSAIGLPTKYAQLIKNARLHVTAGSVSIRDLLYTFGTADSDEPITGLWRYYQADADKYLIATHGDEIELGNDTTGAFTNIFDLSIGDYKWSFLTWHDLAIGGDGYNQPVKYDGDVVTYLGSCGAADNGSGSGPDGSYTYKVTFYSTTYTIILNQPSNSVTVSDNDIDLTMIPIGPDTILGEAITGRKIYRNTVATPGTWQLLSNGTIANNTATTLTDSDADGALGANYPAGDVTWRPPKGKFFLVHNNRLLIANNPDHPSRVFYSEDASHEVFKNTSYFDIRKNDGDEITFIKNLLGECCIGKTNTIQYLYTRGDDPASDWEISDPFSHIGCIAPYSAVNTPLGIFYLSFDGIYTFNGSHSLLLSDVVTPTINDILTTNLDNIAGAFSDNLYYLAYPSKESGIATNNRILIYDIISKAFVTDYLNVNVFCVLSGGSDAGILYAGAADSGNIYMYGTTAKEVIHKTWGDFTGTWDDMRYIPTVAGGSSTSPTLELAWACTIDEWLAHCQAKEISINIIDDIHLDGCIIDRPDEDGTYISPVLETTGAVTYDQLTWNESFTAGVHMEATFAIRTGSIAHPDATWAGWSDEYDNAAGSDISAHDTANYTQYRITLATNDIRYSPNITTTGGYTVKLTYNTAGTVADSSIPFEWEGGWLDFGAPKNEKALRKMELWYSSDSAGTLTLRFDEWDDDYQSYDIDLNTYPDYYSFYFDDGGFYGKLIKITLTKDDLNAFTMERGIITYDLEPDI